MSSKTGQDDSATDFGFRAVPADDKGRLVRGVFNSVADRYDLMNDLMSGGLHRLWKRELAAAAALGRHVRQLDMAGGTGDIAERVLARARARDVALDAVVCDVNEAMLAAGRRRAGADNRLASLSWLCADAEALPFADSGFDLYTVAFGIRNVTRRDRALSEAVRVLRPGGQFLCLEFAPVSVPLIKALYDRYSFSVIPWLGERVVGDGQAYRYLVESIRRFPEPPVFAAALEAAGLSRVSWRCFNFGIVALHMGWKI